MSRLHWSGLLLLMSHVSLCALGGIAANLSGAVYPLELICSWFVVGRLVVRCSGLLSGPGWMEGLGLSQVML